MYLYHGELLTSTLCPTVLHLFGAVPCWPFFNWLHSKIHCSPLEYGSSGLVTASATLMMWNLHPASLSCLGSSYKQVLQETPLPSTDQLSLFLFFSCFFLCSCGRGSPGKSVTSTMRQGMILTWSPPELSDQDTHSLRDICNLLFKRALRVGLDQDSLSICQTTQAYKPCFWKVWIYSSCQTCQPKMGKRFSHVYIFILKCSAIDQPC